MASERVAPPGGRDTTCKGGHALRKASDGALPQGHQAGWTPRVRDVIVDLVGSLLSIRDELAAGPMVPDDADDEIAMARTMLKVSEDLDLSGSPLEDLVSRDHLAALVAELEGSVQ